MALRSDFESLCGSILHCNPLPFIDDVVNELLVEEIRLASQPQANIVLQSQGTSSLNISSDKWIIDSGAINHMSHYLPSFVSLSPNTSISIATANGDLVPLFDISIIATPYLSLSDVYYIPSLAMNLTYVGKIC